MTRCLPPLLALLAIGFAALAPAMAEIPHAADEPAADASRPLALVMDVAVEIGIGVLVVGIVLCLYRILRGPHLADRVLANDALALHVVGLVIILAIYLRTTDFLDVALVVAIIGFAGTLAFAQYIARRDGGAARPDAPGRKP
ncbi:MAG: monovalent cation/H+ antiporter complex subunit F [Phycisphaeraceae bacterium]